MKWQRIVERLFPHTGPVAGPSREAQPHRDGNNSHGSNSGNRGRSNAGGGNGFRGGRGGHRGSTFGGGRGGGGSRVNPRPSNAGPPAKVRYRKVFFCVALVCKLEISSLKK
jgi:hypothetical protein